MIAADNIHLRSLLQLYNIQHDGTLKSIIKETQKEQHNGGWLRSTEERYQIRDNNLPASRELLYMLFEKLGFLSEKAPTAQYYTYALVLGSELETMRIRLAYISKLWNNDIRFEKIIFLCGRRPLFPTENFSAFHNADNGIIAFDSSWKSSFTLEIFNTQVKTEQLTEYTLTQLLYTQSALPVTLRKVPVLFLGTPMKIEKNDIRKRPNTLDTVHDWLKTDPTPGSCLAISDQPQILYQDSVLKTALPSDFQVETVGPAVQQSTQVGETLDALARYLYQEHERLCLL